MQGVHVADYSCLEVMSYEPRSGLPVVERDAQLIITGRQRRDVDFAAQRDDGAGADAGVALGYSLAVLVEDMYGERVTGEQGFVNAAEVDIEAQRAVPDGAPARSTGCRSRMPGVQVCPGSLPQNARHSVRD